MPNRFMECLAGTERLAEVFDNASVLQALLDFETALARAEASCGVITAAEAEQVQQAAQTEFFDSTELSRRGLRAGTIAIPLVEALRARGLRSVHHGATSQDAVDTALILLLKRCRPVLAADNARLIAALTRLARDHDGSVMLGRTLLQPAPPVTFGLKAAGWLGAVRRGWSRVDGRFGEALYLQFGGASGTLAALGDRGLAVSEALAQELSLKLPDAPWHTHRDRLAALLAALSVYTASLGKMAVDIALLMQHEVAEAAEPGGSGRGGSSTMPHKRNPTACMLTIAAARRTPGLLANFLNGMLQEHERAVGGWQSEWPAIEGILQAAGVALESMVEVAEGLSVDAGRMRANIEATHGAAYSERERLNLAGDEEYLGSAEIFRERLLQGD